MASKIIDKKLWAIILLISTLVPTNNAAINWSLVTSIITDSISAGSSVTGSTLIDASARVSVGFEIENWTKYRLIDPEVDVKAGVLRIPPHIVLPLNKEGMSARKTYNTATGSYGTVSWLVEGLNRRIVVMWSAPYSFDFHSNWLGLGITKPAQVTHNYNWFKEMHDRSCKGTGLAVCKISEYYRRSEQISVRDDRIEVLGIMGTSHTPMIKIIVRPVLDQDLPEKVIGKMKKP